MKQSQIIARAIYYLDHSQLSHGSPIDRWEIIRALETILLEMQQKEMQNKETNK